jgi:hypothetical protein
LAIDYGVTVTSGMQVLSVERLRGYYGVHKHHFKIVDPYQMMVEFRTFWGQEVLVPGNVNTLSEQKQGSVKPISLLKILQPLLLLLENLIKVKVSVEIADIVLKAGFIW